MLPVLLYSSADLDGDDRGLGVFEFEEDKFLEFARRKFCGKQLELDGVGLSCLDCLPAG